MQAIPAAIGLGTSVVGGIQGKGAAKQQRKLAEQQMKQLQPLIEAQIAGSRFGIDQARGLYGMAGPQIQGAESAIRDLQRFWRPTMSGDRSAISQFFAPERRAINEGYRTAAENIARFAPRGGGRVGSLARADIGRQGQLSDTIFAGRREGANQMTGLAGMLSQLGLGTLGGATSTLGAGLSGGQGPYNLLNNQQNRAYDATFNRGGSGQQIGGFLVDLFKGLPFGKGGGSNPTQAAQAAAGSNPLKWF